MLPNIAWPIRRSVPSSSHAPAEAIPLDASPTHLPLLVWATGIYFAINVALLIVSYPVEGGPDWALWSALSDSIARGAMYDTNAEARFVWSPVAGWVMSAVPTTIGYWPWYMLHLAVILLLRDWRLIGLALITAGIWIDAAMGNTFTFVFVAAVLAFRGSGPGALVYLALCLLVPRPLQLPLAAWLLWKRPSVRLPFVAMVITHSAMVIVSGYADDWLAVLSAQTANGNVGPTALVGNWWFIVGVPFAAVLTLMGRVGLAGVALSPYMLGAYWLWPAVEIPRSPRRVDRGIAAGLRAGADQEQHRHVVAMDLAPARVLGGAGDEGGFWRQQDRIGPVRVQE